MRYSTLKRSAEFKRVRGGVRAAGPLFIVEGKVRRPTAVPGAVAAMPAVAVDATRVGGATQVSIVEPRFGFTITKKVGSAVVRNRIRRRLKEALRGLEPQCAKPDHDYVVVASRAVHDYPFAELQAALRGALNRLQRPAKGAQAVAGPAMSSDGSGQIKRGDGSRAGPLLARGGDGSTVRTGGDDK